MIVEIDNRGFPENHFVMTVDLAELCRLYGVKEEIQVGGKWVKRTVYPVSKAREIFKLINNYCGFKKVLEVQEYLDKNNKKYAADFKKIYERTTHYGW